jgi:ferredoxin, 2Fe-2S
LPIGRGVAKSTGGGHGTGAPRHEPIEPTRRNRTAPAGTAQAKISIGSFAMVKITFIDSAGTARTVEGEVGSTVMETAINSGVPEIEAECGGACACSTCHVYIDEAWREKVGEPSPMEEDMLDFAFEVRPSSRLSCQIKVREDLDGLVVTTPSRQA